MELTATDIQTNLVTEQLTYEKAKFPDFAAWVR